MIAASAGVLACLFCAMLLAGCGKPAQPVSEAPPAKPAAKDGDFGAARPAGAAQERLAPAPDEALASRDPELDEAVDAILRRHPEMSAQNLLNVPEVNQCLRDFLKELGERPDLRKRVDSSIAFAAAMKNLGVPKDQLNFSMDLSGYGPERTRRLLASLLSRKAERVVDFFEREVGEATADFTFDPGAPKSANGISIQPKAAAP